jgi:hypothetical protein
MAALLESTWCSAAQSAREQLPPPLAPNPASVLKSTEAQNVYYRPSSVIEWTFLGITTAMEEALESTNPICGNSLRKLLESHSTPRYTQFKVSRIRCTWLTSKITKHAKKEDIQLKSSLPFLRGIFITCFQTGRLQQYFPAASAIHSGLT